MFGVAMRILPRIPISHSPVYNLILSNVPGPQAQLYFLGCKIDTMYPLGPIFGGAGLNITVMSLNGELGIGLIACPDLLPDLWDIADAFPDALKELLECSAAQPEGSYRRIHERGHRSPRGRLIADVDSYAYAGRSCVLRCPGPQEGI
jgi:diacylglycerol O-acyltransferase / wax synthase